eukprot:g32459.t1
MFFIVHCTITFGVICKLNNHLSYIVIQIYINDKHKWTQHRSLWNTAGHRPPNHFQQLSHHRIVVALQEAQDGHVICGMAGGVEMVRDWEVRTE